MFVDSFVHISGAVPYEFYFSTQVGELAGIAVGSAVCITSILAG